VKGYPVRIIDTRKTTPGLRVLEKYAVRAGGGYNHRITLADGVLIKDNHIKAAGGITPAVEAARENAPHTLKIEVEVESLKQTQEAISAGADIIMLDNMSMELMAQAVKLIGKKALVEASGNMDEKNLKEVAATGVNFISIGALTHTIKPMDISLKFV
jgi:nicotinate-nucleotide pyrophosphorylase (carboxylating)